MPTDIHPHIAANGIDFQPLCLGPRQCFFHQGGGNASALQGCGYTGVRHAHDGPVEAVIRFALQAFDEGFKRPISGAGG